jgi:hypothetical protein
MSDHFRTARQVNGDGNAAAQRESTMMKIRRIHTRGAVRHLSLDPVDAFLLLHVRGTIPFEVLLATAPCDEQQLLRRLHKLSTHGLVELVADSLAQASSSFDDDAITSVRPGPPASRKSSAPTMPPRAGVDSGVFESVATRPFLQALEEG